jgi:hypothetical protein
LEDARAAGWIEIHEWQAADDVAVLRQQAELERRRVFSAIASGGSFSCG